MLMKKIILIFMSLGALSLSALDTEKKPDNGLYAEINTNRGTMLILFQRRFLFTVTNFCRLAGRKRFLIPF